VVRVHVLIYPDCFIGMPAVIVLWCPGLSENHVETCPMEAAEKRFGKELPADVAGLVNHLLAY
jgi:hypothetical protein